MKIWFSVRDPYKYSSFHETCLLLAAYAHLSRIAVEAGDAPSKIPTDARCYQYQMLGGYTIFFTFFGGLVKSDELKP